MKQPYKNIREVFCKALKKEYASNSDRSTFLYELPSDAFPGAENYLLKIYENIYENPRQAFDKTFENTTSLTPITLGITKNFGQPLLVSGNTLVQIVRKLSGVTLEQLHDGSIPKYHRLLSSLPEPTLKKYLEDLLVLIKAGLAPEYSEENILLDEKRELHLLDVMDVLNVKHYDQKKRIEAVKDETNLSVLLGDYGFFPPAIQKKLRKISEEIGFPKTAEEVGAMLDPTKFAKLHTIEHLGTISLDDTPHALQEMLKEVEIYNQKKAPTTR